VIVSEDQPNTFKFAGKSVTDMKVNQVGIKLKLKINPFHPISQTWLSIS